MGKGGSGAATGGDMMSAFASMQAAQEQYALGMQQLDWAKGVYNDQKPYMQQEAQNQIDAQTQSNNFAQQQQQFYTNTYQPMEQQFAQTAQNWDTNAREQQNAGAAEATTSSQFDQARTAAQSQLESFGVDPSSTRYAALDVGSRAQQAAASASAGNTAIQNTKMQGLALQSQAINTGRGYPSAINQTTGTGSAAGSAGANTLNSSFSTGANAMNGASTWFNAGNSAMANVNNAWGNYNTAYQAGQNSSSGIGGILGTVLGSVAGKLTFAEGGEVPDQPQEQAPAQAIDRGSFAGHHVPAAASPTGGRAIDDVPARLNVDEFVIPRDVVHWEGEKAMYGLIEKAQKERAHKESTTHIRPGTMAIPQAA
ncbi:hypothetical protein [Methylocystis heyeri]|uniref:Tail fiber domain-containing protein n=1 Tax=Methylocystis heyeri TaxID=391905 RepID=A0A6B8KGL3_9HYPH|nr:hypothetical protein [Methylocystis heyeri]QGM46131.1 hypothetical protein H2LOC_010730 [Methylocystis heyeri]